MRYDTDGSLEISGARRVHTWSPRLGFAIALDKGSKTVLRLSGGLYHDAEHTNLAGAFIHNTLLAKRAVNLNWNPALGGLSNPFYDPRDPTGSAARLRQFLAEAFARNRIPDLNAIPVQALAPSINGIDDNFTVPENQQLLAGLSRQLTQSMSVSADYIYSKTCFLLVLRDTNVTPANTRPNPNFASIGSAGSYGRGQYSALALGFDLRQTKRHGGFSYTLARCNDNTGTILQGGSATSPFNLEIDRGACDNDRRHTLVARGGYNLPFGLEASTIYTYRSAPPYSATTAPLPLFTRFEPRNRRRADDFSSWDMRFGRNTRITERVSVRLFAEFFNLLNQRNFTGFVGNNLSSSFLKPTSALPPRRIQFGARVDF